MSSNVIRKKIDRPPGRPRIGKEIANVFAIRLPEEITKAVDAYAKCQAIKTRAQAIRRLVERGLVAAQVDAQIEANRAAPKRRPAKRKR
jgi:hypothetical protein